MTVIGTIVQAGYDIVNKIFSLEVVGTTMGTLFDVGLVLLFGMAIIGGAKVVWDRYVLKK